VIFSHSPVRRGGRGVRRNKTGFIFDPPSPLGRGDRFSGWGGAKFINKLKS